MTQPKPKKCNRPLPDGWTEEELDKQLKQAADKLFGGMTNNGILKVTPESLTEIFKRAKKRMDESKND